MDEQELRALLIRGTEDRPPGIDLMPAPHQDRIPLPSARQGGVLPPSARRRGRILLPLASVAAAAVAVAAVVAAITVIVPGSQSSAQAQARVVAAIENTGQESYRIHTESGDRTFEGAFDPVRQEGVITRQDGTETRFVGDTIYVRESGETTWSASPRNLPELENAPTDVALVKLAPLDPQAALQRLRSATDVQDQGPASGDGWSGERFAFALQDPQDGEAHGITGTVDVDDQGRVRRLEVVYGETDHKVVMTIGDFGASVDVEAPPASEVREQPFGKPVKEVKKKPA